MGKVTKASQTSTGIALFIVLTEKFPKRVARNSKSARIQVEKDDTL